MGIKNLFVMKFRHPSKMRKCCAVILSMVFHVVPVPLLSGNEDNLTVSGVITDRATGETLAGVNVGVRGSSEGAASDLNGRYSISVAKGTTLIFSCVGYGKREILATESNPDVAMEEDAELLNDVIFIGYGVQRKKLLTGATIQVKGDDLAKLNTVSPLQALQGQTPGVQIAATSGQPGSAMKVTVRGPGTIDDSGTLYVIDGIAGDVSVLNPADIQSIDVLKDAASAAIYGAQAANGVVPVTTKQGSRGRGKVSFDAYYGVQKAARKAPMPDARAYKTIMNEQSLNSGGAFIDFDESNVWSTEPISTVFSVSNMRTKTVNPEQEWDCIL